MSESIQEYVKDKIYIVDYPIRFGGMDLFSRMTIVKLDNGQLWVHSPSKIDTRLKSEIDSIGEVAYVIAPGNFHHLNMTDAQSQYPNAETFICPGLEKKRSDLSFD